MSSNDREALVSIRLVHKFLEYNDLTWDDVINPKEQTMSPREIEEMFLECLEYFYDKKQTNSQTFQFLVSLRNFYLDNFYLSDKQKESLKKIRRRF